MASLPAVGCGAEAWVGAPADGATGGAAGAQAAASSAVTARPVKHFHNVVFNICLLLREI
jgi:hypothetical protein